MKGDHAARVELLNRMAITKSKSLVMTGAYFRVYPGLLSDSDDSRVPLQRKRLGASTAYTLRRDPSVLQEGAKEMTQAKKTFLRDQSENTDNQDDPQDIEHHDYSVTSAERYKLMINKILMLGQNDTDWHHPLLVDINEDR